MTIPLGNAAFFRYVRVRSSRVELGGSIGGALSFVTAFRSRVRQGFPNSVFLRTLFVVQLVDGR